MVLPKNGADKLDGEEYKQEHERQSRRELCAKLSKEKLLSVDTPAETRASLEENIRVAENRTDG